MDHKGFFVTFEGIDGCGKSTQKKRVADRLVREKIPHHVTEEPTRGEIGQLLRTYLKRKDTFPPIDALLFAADRLDHWKNEIDPHLQQNEIVISDRYKDSSLAYQTIQSESLGSLQSWIETINRFAPKPDLVFLFDLDPVIALRRRYSATTEAEREKFEQLEFQQKLRQIFLSICNSSDFDVSKVHYVIIDASQSEEEITAQIMQTILLFHLQHIPLNMVSKRNE